MCYNIGKVSAYMEIKTEKQMVSELAKRLTIVFNTDTAVTELSAGYGIVDIAFAKNFFTAQNKIEREPLNNYLALKIVLGLEKNKTFSFLEAMKISGTSEGTCRKILKSLVELDYIEKIDFETYKKTYVVRNPIKKIVAIEAKLKDWKQGIVQARRYKSFTDECYLALLSQYEKNVDYGYLERFGIGLILFNPDSGKIIFKKRPKKNQFLAFHSELSSVFAKEVFLHNFSVKTFSGSPATS